MMSYLTKYKKGFALGLVGVILTGLLLPQIIKAFILDPLWNEPNVAASWDERIVNEELVFPYDKYEETGMAFNATFYHGAYKGGRWPLGGPMYLEQRPGYDNSGYEGFHMRHTFCTANHKDANSLEAGSRAFLSGQYYFSDEMDRVFHAAKRDTDPAHIKFNFLMLALACDYPTEYTIDPNAMWVSDDPGAPAAVVSQMIAFEEHDPEIHQFLNSPIDPNCEAYQNGMRNQAEKIFYDLWTATNMTSKLEPD